MFKQFHEIDKSFIAELEFLSKGQRKQVAFDLTFGEISTRSSVVAIQSHAQRFVSLRRNKYV